MANQTSEISFAILKSIGLPAVLSTSENLPAIILQKSGTSLTFSIDVACSGIYSIITFAAFSSFTAYILRGPIQKRAVIFFLGFPLIYALNILNTIVCPFSSAIVCALTRTTCKPIVINKISFLNKEKTVSFQCKILEE